MASILEQLQIKYKGLSKDKKSDEKTTRITYQGSKELCEAAYNDPTLIAQPELGTIDEVHLSPDEGTFWNLEVTYKIENANSSWVPLGDDEEPPGEVAKGTSLGPTQRELTVRMMSRPIEQSKNYRKNWNNNLYCTRSDIKQAYEMTRGGVPLSTVWWLDDGTSEIDGQKVPVSWLETAGFEYPGGETSPISNFFYAWGRSYGDLPSLPSNYKWFIVRSMTKPNVETFDYPVYELTEYSYHDSQQKASWAVTAKAGKIVYLPKDFSIRYILGGNWLCEGGSIVKQDKYWLATLTYLHSGDENGWDENLYDTYYSTAT